MTSSSVLRVVAIGAHQLLAVVDRLNSNLCLLLTWWERQGDLPTFSTDSASTIDIEGIASTAPMYNLSINEEQVLVNGWDANKIWDGTTLREAGADAAAAPTIAAGGGTGLTGTYTALYTYFDTARGYETSPATTAPSVVTLTNQSLAVTVVASSNTRFDKIRIYRTKTGVPGTFYLDQDVANASATIESTQADSALVAQVSYGNYRFPPSKFVSKSSNRVFLGGARPFREGTVTVTQDSTTVTFTEVPPPNLYTRNVEAPFYFQVRGGPRYGVTAISGTTVTLATAYKGATASGQSYSLYGLQNRVYYSDTSSTGLLKLESWNPSNYFNVGLRGNIPGRDFPDDMSGLYEYGNRVYVFMREGIWYFDPLLTQRKRTAAVTGTPAQNTICENKDGYLVYLGTDNQVYVFNGASSVLLSGKMLNQFAKRDRYNLNLMEYAWAEYDKKESLYVLRRPKATATLTAMSYVVDIYDDTTGRWTEAQEPAMTAGCRVRETTRYQMLAIDKLGLVQVTDNYEDSSTFGEDAFTPVTPTILTSVAGEISPGSNKKGKVAVVFTATAVKGAKYIVGTQSTSALVEDLGDAVTVAAGDSYFIGGWHAVNETGWMDLGDAESQKGLHSIEGTFIKGSSGFLFISWYLNESTVATGTVRINVANERSFRRGISGRGRQIKFKFEGVCESVGFGLRNLKLKVHEQGPV